MQTTSVSQLFQSDHQLARASFREAKSRLHLATGDPIHLGTKPLRVVVTQAVTLDAKGKSREAEAWCAESGGVIRRVGLESGATKQIFRGHTGPVTSLEFYTIPSAVPDLPAREVLISGSWDKSFRIWDTQTKTPLSTTLAHIDFVKALLVIPELKILITASSDKDIRIWDLTSLESRDLAVLVETDSKRVQVEPVESLSLEEEAVNGTKSTLPPIALPTGAAPPAQKAFEPLPLLLTLKGHTRPIERLAYYALTSPSVSSEHDDPPTPTGNYALVSVDSMGALKVWQLVKGEGGEIEGELKSECRPHENGIFDLMIGDEEIWTASGDNSILLSTFDASNPALPPLPSLRIPHHKPLKSLLPLALFEPTMNSSLLLTGSTDESMRIYNLALLSPSNLISKSPWTGQPLALDQKGEGMMREIEGHSHDIIEIGSYLKQVEAGKKEVWILTASLDGTLRRWKWSEMLQEKIPLLEKHEEKEEVVVESLFTEEEEKELAELMRDDDE